MPAVSRAWVRALAGARRSWHSLQPYLCGTVPTWLPRFGAGFGFSGFGLSLGVFCQFSSIIPCVNIVGMMIFAGFDYPGLAHGCSQPSLRRLVGSGLSCWLPKQELRIAGLCLLVTCMRRLFSSQASFTAWIASLQALFLYLQLPSQLRVKFRNLRNVAAVAVECFMRDNPETSQCSTFYFVVLCFATGLFAAGMCRVFSL